MRSFSFTDLLKRALPFFAALVIGVFIASFFVDLSKPRFGRGWRGHKHHEMKRLRIENEELKNENLRLRNQVYELEALRDEHLGMPTHGHGFGSGIGHGRLGTNELPATGIDESPAPPPTVKRVQ